MSVNKKGPVIEGGSCRCCGLTKKCRLLNVEYEFCGQKEVYFEMFVDCFGLLLSHLEGEEADRLICATCVTRLRDATAFRRQVLQCEEKLLQAQMQFEDDNKMIKDEVQIKEETLDECDATGDMGDRDDYHENSADVDEDLKKEIKKESPQKKKSVKRRLLKRKADDSSKRSKKVMLVKIKKIKEQFEEIQTEDPSVPLSQIRQKPIGIWKSAKTKAFHNMIVLVENSYVCPFVTTFSNFFCVYCKEMFTDPEKLREHTLNHDPRIYQDAVTYKKELQIDIARIDCRLCPEPIDNLDDFYKHITSVHDKMLYPNIKNEFLKFNLKLGKVACIECGNTYTNFHALKRHMAEHFGTCICDICGGHFFEENQLIVHQRSHQVKSNTIYPCKECGKVFKSKHGMYYHVSRTHSSEPTFPCYKCDVVLFSQTLRYRHMIEAHGELARSFPCDHCDKVYDTRKSLREHNRKNHLKVLRHECNICERKFYLPSALKDHMASHTGERNFRCEYCGKSYPRMRALRVHMQSHESEKRYKCGLCGASYTQSNNLKNHMKTKHQGAEYVEELQ